MQDKMRKEICRLDSIADLWYKGQPFRKTDIINNGAYPCIHYGELFSKYGAIIDSVVSRCNTSPKRLSQTGDILFPASDVTPAGLARCSVILQDNVILGGDIIGLRPQGGLNPVYLSYAIRHQRRQLLQRVTGSLIKHISAKSLHSVLIPVHCIERQNLFEKQVRLLSSIIDHRHAQLTALNGLVKCRFVEQFGNCKHVLEGWKRMTIGQACSLVNGRAFKPSDWVKEGTPIVRIQNLKDPTAEFNYCDGNVEGKFWIDTGTLLFAWSGTPGTSFGAFIWAGGKAVLNQHIFQVHPCPDISKQFLKYSFAAHMDEIIEKAHGSAGLRHITKQELEKIMLLIPPMEVQKSFVNFAQQCDKLRFVSAFHQINALLGMQKV